MLEPDPTTRTVPTHAGAPTLDAAPHARLTSRYDDQQGVLLTALGTTSLPRHQPFLGIPGIIAVIDCVVAGAAAAIAALALGAGVGGALAVGAAAFALSLLLFVRWAGSRIAAWGLESRFPTPPLERGRGA